MGLRDKNKPKEEKSQHSHIWVVGGDISCHRCECGAILISEMEYQRRVEEWQAYYEIIRTTKSYLCYQEIREALFNMDFAKVKLIIRETKERLNDSNYEYLPKPEFPDPTVFSKYVII